MKLKNFRLKIKGIKLIKRFVIGNGRWKARKQENNEKKVPWMMMHHVSVSHGYHVVEIDRSWTSSSSSSSSIGSNVREFDSVVVQREQIQHSEFCLFGVFDNGIIAQGVYNYLQSHFFHKMPPQSFMVRKSKAAMKRAHLTATSKLKYRAQAGEKPRESASASAASAMVINGEKLVMANMGDYRAVICRDGEAYQICRKKQQPSTGHWSFRLISGGLGVPKVKKIAGEFITKRSRSSEVVVGSERIDSQTEFVILASNGVWEVMKHQEAVNLIRHIEDPQAAAECLATEALIRMSKSIISCLIIRFD